MVAVPHTLFIEIGFIVILSVVLGTIARYFKQPLILAYIVAGVILGPAVLNAVSGSESVEAFSQIGIAFLLFLVGLNLNTKVLREVGKVSIITGMAQVIFTSVVGYGLSILLGFSPIASIYIAIALTFSSTVIIVKILTDKKDLNTLYGKISIGFLLVQDIMAIFILIFLAGLSGGANPLQALPITLLKAGILIGLTILSGKIITPFVFPRAAKLSQELLFLAAIGWMFLLATLSIILGLSIEIGAFLAGVGLASLPYVRDLHSKIKPLRDFFIVLFFIHLGTSISLPDVASVVMPAIILSLFVLIGNPLIVMVLMKNMGYTRKTGLLTGLTVSQISEFSLIIAALGLAIGHITSPVVGLITLVGVITITISTYMITYAERIYNGIKKPLMIFEPKKIKEKASSIRNNKYDYVFLGAHRMTKKMMELIDAKTKKKILIVDINPKLLKTWSNEGFDVLYGDIEDSDVMEEIIELKPKAVFSSVPGPNDNIRALKILKPEGIKYVANSLTVEDALWLYEHGADYVIVPHVISGERAYEIMKKLNRKDMNKTKKEHIKDLNKLID